ncbi:DUF3108 domain-containing protein [Rhodoferax aquaticus]|uniref:DUF3108 domain-containing protein n=1 Tax=Rhodoferax aquaticus TaxID=2527691 RepID=A0A515EK77_9BURK|nr:DUF3108 domain-containing protein [Rhodoferax aquaticus]QDL52999.1 DUF3108 domain-containing protein [Rhodoferax aquaticus]
MPIFRSDWPRIAMVLGTVLLAHGWVLQNPPSAWHLMPAFEDKDKNTKLTFTTRSVAFGEAKPQASVSPKATAIPSPRPSSSAAERHAASQAPTIQSPQVPEAPPTALVTPPSNDPLPAEVLAAAVPLPPKPEPEPIANTQAMHSQVSTHRFLFPGSVQLNYDVKANMNGFPIAANGELRWVQDGKFYEARLKWGNVLVSRTLTSKGELSAQGLEPTRFGDKVRSEQAAHFVRERGQVVFSANTPDIPIEAGAQDRASVFIQLAAMFGGEPERFPAGSSFAFQTVDARAAETWRFKVAALEPISLPSGNFNAIKLLRDPVGDYGQKVEVWLAPTMSYLPVHIRITEANGNVLDQVWRSSETP